MEYTISHKEGSVDNPQGWTSFWSYKAGWLCKLNNRFFTIKNGQLWEHHDNDNPIRNNFYGVQYGSSIRTVISDEPSDDKIFKTVILESEQAWDVSLRTNMTEGVLDADEFDAKESRFFAFFRKNENGQDLRGQAANGIGAIVSHTGLTVTYASLPDLISVGDVLYQLSGSNQQIIGTITAIDRVLNKITVNAITTAAVNGLFSFTKKNARSEGSEQRGYFIDLTLTNSDISAAELYAVSVGAVKSFI